MPRNRNPENRPPSDGDKGKDKKVERVDLTRCLHRQKSSQSSVQELRTNPGNTTETHDNELEARDQANRNKLEWFVSAKVTEELIGRYKDKNDLGLGFDKYLGWSATDTNLEGIRGDNLCVFKSKKEETYYITNNGNEQKYNNDDYNKITIAEMSKDLLENIERGFVDVELDLPKIHAGRKKDNWRYAQRGVVITDNEKYLPETMTRTKDAGKTQSSNESDWKRILPGTDAGIDLRDKTQLYDLRCSAREKLKNYVARQIMKPLRRWWKNLFKGKKIEYKLREGIFVSEKGQIRVSGTKPGGNGWERVDVDNMSVEQLKTIRERIRDNQGKVECDLKVYMLQRSDQTSSESGSKDKEPDILVTDDRSLVAEKIREDNWKVLPGIQTGIVLNSKEDKIEEKIEKQNKIYEELSKEQGKVSKTLESCEELFSKLYWNNTNKREVDDLERLYSETMSSLANGATREQSVDSFKQGLSQYIESKGLSATYKSDLATLGISVKSESEARQKQTPKAGKNKVVPLSRIVTDRSGQKKPSETTGETGQVHPEKKVHKAETEDISKQDIVDLLSENSNSQWAKEMADKIVKSLSDARMPINRENVQNYLDTAAYELLADKVNLSNEHAKHMKDMAEQFKAAMEYLQREHLQGGDPKPYEIMKDFANYLIEQGKIMYSVRLNQNNCLVHSLIKAFNPQMKDSEIQTIARRARNFMVSSGISVQSEYIDITNWGGHTLHEQAIYAIAFLHDQKRPDGQPLIDINRSLTLYAVYPYSNGPVARIKLPSVTGVKDNNPIELYLEGGHFQAILKQEGTNNGRAPENQVGTSDRTNSSSGSTSEVSRKVTGSKTGEEEVVEISDDESEENVSEIGKGPGRATEGKIEEKSQKDSSERVNLSTKQLAIRSEIILIKKYGSSVMLWYDLYKDDFDKDWLKEGMRSLRMDPNHINQICQEILKNEYVLEVINSGAKSGSIADKWPDGKIGLDKLEEADKHLKSIYEKLRLENGIPLPEGGPKRIGDRYVLPTPSNGFNCQINSLVAAGRPDFLKPDEKDPKKLSLKERWSEIQEKAKEVREYLVNERLYDFDEEIEKAGKDLKNFKDVLAGRERQRRLDRNPSENSNNLEKYKTRCQETINKQITQMKNAELKLDEIIQQLTEEGREAERLHESTRMLSTGQDLEKVLGFLASREWIEPDRGVLVYEWHPRQNRILLPKGYIHPRKINDPAKPPYAVLLQPGVHFEVMVKPEQLGMNEEEIEKIFWEQKDGEYIISRYTPKKD